MDVLGCLLSVYVHAANVHDTKSGMLLLNKLLKNILLLKSFVLILATRGTFVNDIQKQVALDVDISEKIKEPAKEYL